MFTRTTRQFCRLFLHWLLPWLLTGFAQAQSFCSSDGQQQPFILHERFISADCGDCWGAKPSAALPPRSLALDWIVPSPRADEAPLSTAASRDALARLEELMLQPPTSTHSTTHTSQKVRQMGAAGQHLRVAHGLPFNDYIGASVAHIPRKSAHGALTAWLILVETIPAGADGTPVERNLVRGVLVTPFKTSELPTEAGGRRFSESRPMSIPDGAQAQRLRMVGWLQDARGKLVAVAQTRCKT